MFFSSLVFQSFCCCCFRTTLITVCAIFLQPLLLLLLLPFEQLVVWLFLPLLPASLFHLTGVVSLEVSVIVSTRKAFSQVVTKFIHCYRGSFLAKNSFNIAFVFVRIVVVLQLQYTIKCKCISLNSSQQTVLKPSVLCGSIFYFSIVFVLFSDHVMLQ